MNYEIAINLHHLISKGGTGLRFFKRKGVIDSDPVLLGLMEDKLIEHIEINKSDGGAVRVGSLSPLIDIAIKAGVINDDMIMLYYTLYDYDMFAKKINPEVFRDPTGMVAICDHDRADEYIPITEFVLSKSKIKYIYSDKVSIMFMLGTIEQYMKDNSKEIADTLYKLQRGE